MRSSEITVAVEVLIWYRSRGDTASGIVELVEGGPHI